MGRHWTLREQRNFEADWLKDRRPHTWSETVPVRCTRCGRTYKQAEGTACKRHRKPNRYKLHLRRALSRAMYPPDPPPTIDARWVLAQLAELQGEIKRYQKRGEVDLRFWKYHRIARRHRRLMRLWWSHPDWQVPVIEPDRGSSEAWITRGRNKLIVQAQTEKRRVLRRDGCTYEFRPDATIIRDGLRVSLFEQEGASDANDC